MVIDDTSTENDWEYVGSGSANAVFAYKGSCVKFRGKVVRFRLVGTEVSTEEIFFYLQSSAFNSIRKYMVSASLLTIKQQTICEFQTLAKCKGLSIKLDPNETYCLIMKNILSHSLSEYERIQLSKYHIFLVHKAEKEIVFEFKPKWLYQLPASHKNCRNCLIAKSKGQEFVSCHLKLLKGEKGISEWCKELQEELGRRTQTNIDIFQSLKNCVIANYALILSLYELQNSIEIHDRLMQLTSEYDVNEDLQLNMTLRDVSIFMSLSKGEVFVLDLDKKSAKKWKKWKNQEQKLQGLHEKDLSLNCRFKARS